VVPRPGGAASWVSDPPLEQSDEHTHSDYTDYTDYADHSDCTEESLAFRPEAWSAFVENLKRV